MALAWNIMRKMWFLLLLPITATVSIVWAILDPSDTQVDLKSGCIAMAFRVFFFGVVPYLGTRASRKPPNFGG
jgi:hypothetical protein